MEKIKLHKSDDLVSEIFRSSHFTGGQKDTSPKYFFQIPRKRIS